MQREILFKAKRKDNNEWVYGYIIKSFKTNTYFMATDEDTTKHYWESKPLPEVIPKTISQFTGLTDKNGVKIFENDIVFYSDFASVYKEDITGVIKYTQDCMFKIEYDDKYARGGKTTKTLVCHEHPIFTSKKIEVTGNIFDCEV